jgi:hypothetical protein
MFPANALLGMQGQVRKEGASFARCDAEIGWLLALDDDCERPQDPQIGSNRFLHIPNPPSQIFRARSQLLYGRNTGNAGPSQVAVAPCRLYRMEVTTENEPLVRHLPCCGVLYHGEIL